MLVLKRKLPEEIARSELLEYEEGLIEPPHGEGVPYLKNFVVISNFLRA